MAHDDFRIQTHKVSPLRRDRPDSAVVGLQQNAFAMAVVPPADAGQLPSEQRVKRMRDPH